MPYLGARNPTPAVARATNRSLGIGHSPHLARRHQMLQAAKLRAQQGRRDIRPSGTVPLRKRYGDINTPSRDLTMPESIALQRRQTNERSSRYKDYLRRTPTGPDATSRNVRHSRHLIGWTDSSGQKWQQSKQTGTVQRAAQASYG
jgi:hypothetical protein